MIQTRVTYLNETVRYITFTFLYHVPFLRKSIACNFCVTYVLYFTVINQN